MIQPTLVTLLYFTTSLADREPIVTKMIEPTLVGCIVYLNTYKPGFHYLVSKFEVIFQGENCEKKGY